MKICNNNTKSFSQLCQMFAYCILQIRYTIYLDLNSMKPKCKHAILKCNVKLNCEINNYRSQIHWSYCSNTSEPRKGIIKYETARRITIIKLFFVLKQWEACYFTVLVFRSRFHFLEEYYYCVFYKKNQLA